MAAMRVYVEPDHPDDDEVHVLVEKAIPRTKQKFATKMDLTPEFVDDLMKERFVFTGLPKGYEPQMPTVRPGVE